MCYCAASATVNSSINILKGSIEDDYQILPSQRTIPASLSLRLTYSSRYASVEFYAACNTSLGFGWAHSYQTFLFQQQDAMYRRDGLGRYVPLG
jgi:hypothetical protein